jgi:hypothetical protein
MDPISSVGSFSSLAAASSQTATRLRLLLNPYERTELHERLLMDLAFHHLSFSEMAEKVQVLGGCIPESAGACLQICARNLQKLQSILPEHSLKAREISPIEERKIDSALDKQWQAIFTLRAIIAE